MNLEERSLYHQIHPLKLFVDWGTGKVSSGMAPIHFGQLFPKMESGRDCRMTHTAIHRKYSGGASGISGMKNPNLI